MKVGCVFECLIRFGLCESINNPNVISFQTRSLLKGDERVIYVNEKQTAKMKTHTLLKTNKRYSPIFTVLVATERRSDHERYATKEMQMTNICCQSLN